MILTLIFPLFLFSFAIHGFALVSSNVKPNNSSTSSRLSTTNTSITSFLTLLDGAPSTSPRRRQTVSSRPINTCRSPSSIFMHSHCTHSASMFGSMQSYLVFCRESGSGAGTGAQKLGGEPPTTPAGPRIPRPTAEVGRCRQNEVCMNGRVPGGWGTSMAWCVSKNSFMKMTDAVDDWLTRTLLKDRTRLEMGGLMASAVVSDEEGRTPVKVQELEVEFEEQGSGTSANSSSSSASAKTKSCRDCYELIASDFAPEANLLTTDITVAGTVAVTGILWLAILSG